MDQKMCVCYLGVLLLAVHLLSSPVVQAQSTNATTYASQTNMTTPTMMTNTTEKSGCGRSSAVTLLLPLAVAASLLHGWS